MQESAKLYLSLLEIVNVTVSVFRWSFICSLLLLMPSTMVISFGEYQMGYQLYYLGNWFSDDFSVRVVLNFVKNIDSDRTNYKHNYCMAEATGCALDFFAWSIALLKVAVIVLLLSILSFVEFSLPLAEGLVVIDGRSSISIQLLSVRLSCSVVAHMPSSLKDSERVLCVEIKNRLSIKSACTKMNGTIARASDLSVMMVNQLVVAPVSTIFKMHQPQNNFFQRLVGEILKCNINLLISSSFMLVEKVDDLYINSSNFLLYHSLRNSFHCSLINSLINTFFKNSNMSVNMLTSISEVRVSFRSLDFQISQVKVMALRPSLRGNSTKNLLHEKSLDISGVTAGTLELPNCGVDSFIRPRLRLG